MLPTRIAVLFLLVSIPAQAEVGPRPGPCKDDIDKFCGGKPTPECMKANVDKFSEMCRKIVTIREERRAKVKAACQEDITKLCKDVKEERDVFSCLRKNKAALSAGCSETLHSKRHPQGERTKKK